MTTKQGSTKTNKLSKSFAIPNTELPLEQQSYDAADNILTENEKEQHEPSFTEGVSRRIGKKLEAKKWVFGWAVRKRLSRWRCKNVVQKCS